MICVLTHNLEVLNLCSQGKAPTAHCTGTAECQLAQPPSGGSWHYLKTEMYKPFNL
jgi:hypothetical protein